MLFTNLLLCESQQNFIVHLLTLFIVQLHIKKGFCLHIEEIFRQRVEQGLTHSQQTLVRSQQTLVCIQQTFVRSQQTFAGSQ